MKKKILKYLELTHLVNPQYIFLLFLIAFTLDAVVNFFIDIPVLVPFAILMLPVLWFNLLLGGKRLLFFCIFISVFLLASVVNTFLYPFDKRNISDMLFIIYFATSYFFYKQKSDLLNLGTVNIFIVVCIFMSGLAFFGYDSKSFAYDGAEYEKKVELLKKEHKKIRVSFDKDRLNTLESDKEYHFGLFRMPHLASYFFGFTSIFFGFLFARSLRWYFLVVAMILFMLMLYTGVRTFIAAAILALLVYLFRKKTILYFLSLTILIALAFIFRYEFNSLIKMPFLKAYTGLPILIVDNFDRLSRVLLWKSWWLDV
nr:hypothetical protein [Bacteroidota bacterium]